MEDDNVGIFTALLIGYAAGIWTQLLYGSVATFMHIRRLTKIYRDKVAS